MADILATHNRIFINAQVGWAQVVDAVCHSLFGAIFYAQIASYPIRLATAIFSRVVKSVTTSYCRMA